MKSNWTSDRVMAVCRLVIMLAAAVAGGFGLTVDPDSLLTVAMCIVAGVAGVWSWWKNNNITAGAQEAQKYLDGLKGGE